MLDILFVFLFQKEAGAINSSGILPLEGVVACVCMIEGGRNK
jgi:hypothetical protein